MAAIHILVPALPDPDQGRRLFQDLKAASDAGEDLGSRIPHIRASARALAHLGATLLAKVALDPPLGGEFGMHVPAVADTLRRLGLACQALERTISKLADAPQEAGIGGGSICGSDSGSDCADRARCGARSHAPTKPSEDCAGRSPARASRPCAREWPQTTDRRAP